MEIINVYNFNKQFNFYINEWYNKLIININYKYYYLRIPSQFFIKKEKNAYYFIFLSKFYFVTFLKHLFNYYNDFFNYYYYILKLKGLGYRIFQVSNKLLKIFLNRSNFFYLHVPSTVLLKYRTRRFFFIGTQYNILKVMILRLLFLKEFIIYRVNGIYYTRQILLIKPGKNKFR
jgi:hypothetical protein